MYVTTVKQNYSDAMILICITPVDIFGIQFKLRYFVQRSSLYVFIVSDLNSLYMLLWFWYNSHILRLFTVKPVLKRPFKRLKKCVLFKTGGLLTQVNYSEKCAFWGLKEWSLNTGGLLTQVVLRTGSTVYEWQRSIQYLAYHVHPLACIATMLQSVGNGNTIRKCGESMHCWNMSYTLCYCASPTRKDATDTDYITNTPGFRPNTQEYATNIQELSAKCIIWYKHTRT